MLSVDQRRTLHSDNGPDVADDDGDEGDDTPDSQNGNNVLMKSL